jgi:hypothetical protein
MELTTAKPAPPAATMICAFVRGDAINAVKRVRRWLSREEVAYVARADRRIPDSAACRRALELVRRVSPDYLLNHCLRSHAFGVAMAHKVARRFDPEVFFLGAVMHDLGLCDEYDRGGSFELDGAVAARGFCVDGGLEPARADLVHEMVALHNSVGLADRLDPEIALLHFGAGVDVAGLWLDDVHPHTLAEVIEDFPRIGFTAGMIRLLEDQVARKPASYMATMLRLGFLDKMRKAPFAD